MTPEAHQSTDRTPADSSREPGNALPQLDQDQLRQEQVGLLYGQATFGFIATVLNALLLAYAVRAHVSATGMYLWVGLMLATTGARALLVWRYRVASSIARADACWERYYVAGAAAGGAAWGSASLLLFPETSLPHQIFVLFIFAGMLAGGAIVLNAVRRAFLWYAGLMLIPMMIRIAPLGQELSLFVTTGIGIFLVFVVVTNSNLHAITMASLRLRHENRQLVSSLMQQKQAQERLNAELKTEVIERQAAQEALGRSNERLEQRVRERTGELTQTIQRLQQEVRDRVQAQSALRLSEARYRTLYDDTPSMYFTLDPDGTILSVNSFGAGHLGYTQDELLGRPVAGLFLEAERAEVQLRLQECVAARGQVRSWVAHKLCRDGTVLSVRETARAVQRPDGRDIVLVVCEDITERDRLEQQLRQSQKLDAIGKLTGGIAHDFNNLLTVIRGYTDMMRRRLGDDSPLRTELEAVASAADRAATLTEQLLTFSRQQVVQSKVLDLNLLVDRMLSMLRRVIGSHIQLEIREADSPAWVKADAGQLEQVLMNLVVNARDAMPTGGQLVIGVERVVATASEIGGDSTMKPGRAVKLCVRDSGCGMDVATQAHIFEPFFTTKEVGKGTGLGLSTVYGIVKQSGGHITVVSRPGDGTEFAVFLPEVMEPTRPATDWAPHAAQPAVPELPRGHETIMLVEDDPMVRLLGSQVLSVCGYRVLQASNGHEALALLEREGDKVDLLVTDIMMPEMNGRELVDRVKSVYPTLKTIFVSGYTDNAAFRRELDEAGTPFLQKPFTPPSLAQKVRDVLDRGSSAA